MKKILICLFTLLLIISFSSCGSKSADSPMEAPMQEAQDGRTYEDAYAEEATAEYAYEYDEAAPQAKSAEESAVALPILTPEKSGGKQIVYSATLQLQTEDFMKGIRLLIDTLNDMDGYVERATVNGRNMFDYTQERHASYEVRVPVEQFAEFLVIMEDNYNLTFLQQDSQEITATYTRTSDELEILEEEKQRLEKAIEEAEPEEVEELQAELVQVERQISQLSISKSQMTDAVQYSSATVEIYEVISQEKLDIIYQNEIDKSKQPEIPFSEELETTTNSSMQRFARFGQQLLLVLITLLPAIIIIAILAVIFLLARKFRLFGKVKNIFTSGKSDENIQADIKGSNDTTTNSHNENENTKE